MDRATLARFMRNVTQRPDGCWYWTGPTTPSGYGKFRPAPGARERAAHRVSYEHWRGVIPRPLQLDHLCRVRRCVNPEHLEAVTASENTLRQDHAKRRVLACPAGHDYTPENVLTTGTGARRCRRCEAERKRAARQPGTGRTPPCT